MPAQDGLRAYVDADGRIVLPSETRARLGLSPAAEIMLDELANGVILRRPATHLGKVYVEPTSRCNLDCRICIRNSWDETQGDMSEGTYNRLLDGLKDLEHKPVMVLGGFGEPLLHPKILEMLARAKEVAQRVEVITNGLLLSEQMAREFIRLRLDMVWFSVDRFHADAYGSDGTPLSNMERLNRLRRSLSSQLPETGIVFVATSSNVERLPDLLRSAGRYGVSRCMVTNVLPYTLEMCAETLYKRSLDLVDGTPLPWSLGLELPRMDLDQNTLMVLDQVLRARHNVRLNDAGLNPTAGRCPFIESGAVAVSWDGAVSPCLGLMHSHVSYLSNKPRSVRRYAVGNINDLSLDEIWNEAEHLAFRKRVQEFDFSPCTWCRACEKAEANQEDCFGNTFPTCGGCLWAWGVIQCP